jgi:hypothetical protein
MSNNDYKILNDKINDLCFCVVNEDKRDKIISVDNKPIKIRLVGSNKDDKERSCVVVANESGLMFDMKLDVFMEAWAHGGMDVDGNLNDEFIFAKQTIGLNLIRYNSELYKAIVSSQNRKKKPKIKNKDLQYGRVYKSPTGNCGIFLGYVTSVNYTHIANDNDFRILKKKIINKAGLWYDITRLNDLQVVDNMHGTFGKTLKINHSYIQATDRIFDNINANVVQNITQSALNLIEKSNFYDCVIDYGKLANMSRWGCHYSFGDRSNEIEKYFNGRNSYSYCKIKIIE